MEKAELEELKEKVPCGAVLEHWGFALDLKESTRRAMKYRRGDAIIIVIHDGKGWFDPLSDAKGDVYSLVQHLDGCDFLEAFVQVASLVGFVPSEPAWTRQPRNASRIFPFPNAGEPGPSHGVDRRPGAICVTTVTFPNASSAPQSLSASCAKARMAACGRHT